MDHWKAGKEVTDRVKHLIANYHPHLALIEEDIVVVFKDRATEKCGLVIPGNTKKAPPLMNVLTDKKFDYKFIIEIGSDAWHDLTMSQQEALLDHHLCAMQVEEDPKSGGIRCSLRPPDFVGYKEEVERHGMWRPMDDDTLSVIEEMFGKKARQQRRSVQKRVAGSGEDLESILDEAAAEEA